MSSEVWKLLQGTIEKTGSSNSDGKGKAPQWNKNAYTKKKWGGKYRKTYGESWSFKDSFLAATRGCPPPRNAQWRGRNKTTAKSTEMDSASGYKLWIDIWYLDTNSTSFSLNIQLFSRAKGVQETSEHMMPQS